ncbi:MAG: GEVED domain-containing protein [Bacteroidetes bacterium]|nr:GEVED domain-containing protein [Bacteroidota bacterium]
MINRIRFFAVIFLLFHSAKTFALNSCVDTIRTASSCGPIPAVCYPTTISGGLGIGIYFVSLNQISNASSNPPMLEDFTCTDSTWLVPGIAYNFELHTGNVYEESATAWIDFSNDGDFDPSEIVYHDSALIYIHQGLITVPTNAIHTFTPIRMRIGSESSGNLLTGCNDAYYGQYEDYTIYYGMGIGINDPGIGSIICISPNPFHSYARLQFSVPSSGPTKSEANIYSLKIFNSVGVFVREEVIASESSYILNRNLLSQGLYFFELSSEHGLHARGKFVID